MQIKTKVENFQNYKKYLQVEQAVHEFMQRKRYLKIDLPVLSPALIPESYLEVFETEFRYLQNRRKLYLTPSPELFLKRLLTRGVGSCYYLGKAFRNSEPNSNFHLPEFTMLEYYKMGATYMDIAEELLLMLKYIALRLSKENKVVYKNTTVFLDRWEKLSIAQAFEKYAGISTEELFDHRLFFAKAKKKGYKIDNFSYEDVWSQMYTQEVEPHLGMNGYPTLIYDYPQEFAALAKLNDDGKTAQRFEFYLAGIELGDCYTELTDWKEQKDRFKIEDFRRKKDKKISHPIDKGFIQALQYGLNPCAGIAIGFDRLAMVFTNATSVDSLKLIQIKI